MKRAVLLATLCTALAGCASVVYTLSNPSLALAQTPGEYFRQYLIKRHAECRELQRGPYLPDDERSRRSGDKPCEILLLKPWQPGDSPESAYAHSLKLPPPHDKPVDVYKPGMSPREYFEALCAAQAGEFIFRKVEGVDSIVELRPRGAESSELNRHLTAFEDPATYAHWQGSAVLFLTSPDLFRYAESGKGNDVYRYSRDPTRGPFGLKRDAIPANRSTLGFTWRGYFDQRQLDFGIAGGEFLVVDIAKNEVIGFKRAFKLRWLGRFPSEQRISATGFESGSSCPSEIAMSKTRRYQDFRDFLVNVIVPQTQQN